MDLNKYYLVFSIIIAVCALLSPGVVALINNIYSLKLRELEAKEQRNNRAVDVIDGYFRAAGACLYYGTDVEMSEFGKYSDLVYLYIPEDYRAEISAINESILNRHRTNLDVNLEELAIKCKAQRH